MNIKELKHHMTIIVPCQVGTSNNKLKKILKINDKKKMIINEKGFS